MIINKGLDIQECEMDIENTIEEDGQKLRTAVVIRSRNEERWIGYAVQSVLDHLYKPEIIIVDNNSTDKTLEIVKSFSENLNVNNGASNYSKIKIFNIKDYSPGRALNLGVEDQKNML